MKKIFTLFLALCLVASALCLPAFAADIPVLRVSALKSGETNPVLIGEYTSFEDGWNAAMKIAGDRGEMKKNGYDRIVVDLLAKWSANTAGQFSDDLWNGPGFDNDTIYIPEGAKVTLNMNNHTIDRGLTDDEDDGEVIFINDDADVIINDGVITGGFSNSEGGGLYIEGGAKVTLNRVDVIGNAVKGDDGSAIYLYGGATLIMNGGSISDNVLDEKHLGLDIIEPYGTICAMDSTVILNNVTIDGNYTPSVQAEGVIFYAKGSIIKMSQCTVSNNVTKGSYASHAFYIEDSSLTITDTDFIGNNTIPSPTYVSTAARLFRVEDSNLIMTGGTITQNGGAYIFSLEDTEADITDVTITDNACAVMNLNNSDNVVNMVGCVLGNNTPTRSETTVVVDDPDTLFMLDCTLGDTTFSNKDYVKISTSEVTREEAVIGIELLREDGTVDSVRYYKDFASGWDYAVECAKTNFFARVVVNFYGDWNTYEYEVVSIPAQARMTLNLNGHKIDRATQGKNWNGEVLYVSANADVIINDGTITGGNSRTGASGIHINDNARVVLNDVNVDDNRAEGGSNGAAIAVYNGAVLVMNGGSISDNFMDWDLIPLVFIPLYPYGTLYVEDATATLNNVTISNNAVGDAEAEGAAIYADSSTVTLNDCVVSGNINAESPCYAESVIGAKDSTLIINNTDFTDNGKVSDTSDIDYCSLFDLVDCKLTMNGGKITGNHADKIFYLDDTQADITGVTVTGNASIILDVDNDSAKVTLTECTLGGNEPVKEDVDVIVDKKGTLILTDCELGDTTFDNKRMVLFSDNAVGSILGEGSLTMIVSLIALIASVAAIAVNVSSKKKAVPATANNAAEGENGDEE